MFYLSWDHVGEIMPQTPAPPSKRLTHTAMPLRLFPPPYEMVIPERQRIYNPLSAPSEHLHLVTPSPEHKPAMDPSTRALPPPPHPPRRQRHPYLPLLQD